MFFCCVLQRSRWFVTSQSQSRGVFFRLQSQIRDAWVFVGGFRGRCRRHHWSCRGGFRCERRQGQPERRCRKHHVRRVRRQVRVQVMMRVGHGAVQLQLRLHLKGEGRHVAMTILWTHGWEERGRNTLTWERLYMQSCYWALDQFIYHHKTWHLHSVVLVTICSPDYDSNPWSKQTNSQISLWNNSRSVFIFFVKDKFLSYGDNRAITREIFECAGRYKGFTGIVQSLQNGRLCIGLFRVTCLLEWHAQSSHVDIWSDSTRFKLTGRSDENSWKILRFKLRNATMCFKLWLDFISHSKYILYARRKVFQNAFISNKSSQTKWNCNKTASLKYLHSNGKCFNSTHLYVTDFPAFCIWPVGSETKPERRTHWLTAVGEGMCKSSQNDNSLSKTTDPRGPLKYS